MLIEFCLIKFGSKLMDGAGWHGHLVMDMEWTARGHGVFRVDTPDIVPFDIIFLMDKCASHDKLCDLQRISSSEWTK